VRVLVHAPGDPGHGVVRHARAVADLAGVTAVPDGDADLGHAHFTDALYGPDIARAAAAFAAWAARAPRPLVVTLHDLPGDGGDAARDARRRAGYRVVADAADAVVVSSRHEAGRARALGTATPLTVVPLPLPHPATPAGPPAWAGRPTLVLLGYVYPGKGHDLAIEAAARQPCAPLVVAAGAAADGHAGLVDGLHERARQLGVRFRVSGPLSDADLAAAAAAATVPLAANPQVSASGSLLTWVAHRRRPVTLRGPYAEEVARMSDVVRLCGPGPGLDRAVAEALRDPSSTRLAARPGWPDAGAGHRRAYRAALARHRATPDRRTGAGRTPS
jgi:glycosyltransferase involved in cell wall biosynthesis